MPRDAPIAVERTRLTKVRQYTKVREGGSCFSVNLALPTQHLGSALSNGALETPLNSPLSFTQTLPGHTAALEIADPQRWREEELATRKRAAMLTAAIGRHRFTIVW
jgi:hypothetical protein